MAKQYKIAPPHRTVSKCEWLAALYDELATLPNADVVIAKLQKHDNFFDPNYTESFLSTYSITLTTEPTKCTKCAQTHAVQHSDMANMHDSPTWRPSAPQPEQPPFEEPVVQKVVKKRKTVVSAPAKIDLQQDW